jgi:hypothetical protein
MMGCCLCGCLFAISSRLLLLYGWYVGWYAVFNSALAAVLGWLFLPLTSLAYIYCMLNYGGISGSLWFVIGIAVLADLSSDSNGVKSASDSTKITIKKAS